MRIARVAVMQGRESSIADWEAIRSPRLREKDVQGRAPARASQFLFYFAFWADLYAVWAVSSEGRCLFQYRLYPSIEYLYEHASIMQC